ncbi:acyltransferase family protein [Oerskovia flava]|uniref:acyltransferase family protein n=1 Tax=Oerskovia flava TaxID=2986422 RepID=UPI00223EEE35|nr:acyltransferase [Oerskovia sp. JB1-3-2]
MRVPDTRPNPALRDQVPELTAALPRLAVLDALRFVAAGAVLFYHFTAVGHSSWGAPTPEVFPNLQATTVYGSFGVQLFFVVSGFVILMTAWGRDITRFTVSRASRLFPAYWASVLLTLVLLVVVSPGRKSVDVPEAAANLTMVQRAIGLGDVESVYWTLWAELRFYVLVGVLVAIGLTRGRVIAFIALWPVLAAVASTSGNELVSTVLVASDAPLFAGGMALYCLTREPRSPTLWMLLGLNVLLAAAHSGSIQATRLENSTGVAISAGAYWTAIIVCFAIVALATLTPLNRISWKWLTTLGALTYPLYLVHTSWGRWVIESLYPHVTAAVALAAAAGVSLVLAYAIYRFVERPLGPRMRTALMKDLSGRTSHTEPAHAGRPGGA